MFLFKMAWKLFVMAGVFGVGYVVGREHSFEEEEEWNRENNKKEEDNCCKSESESECKSCKEESCSENCCKAEADAEDKGEKNEVEFEFVDEEASSVALVGCFNDWNKDANPMTKGDDGVWKCTVKLAPGKYEYQFVVNSTDWKSDPKANNVENKYEGTNSVIEIK